MHDERVKRRSDHDHDILAKTIIILCLLTTPDAAIEYTRAVEYRLLYHVVHSTNSNDYLRRRLISDKAGWAGRQPPAVNVIVHQSSGQTS